MYICIIVLVFSVYCLNQHDCEVFIGHIADAIQFI